MQADHFSFLNDWPYLTWALGVATTLYIVTQFATSHLPAEKRAHLSLWLQGDYNSTWSQQFGATFDVIFGRQHLRLRCFALSAVASVAAVFVLWILFDQILGLISLRSVTGLGLVEALLLGAAINIIPDYISLYETRLLLKIFEKVTNPIAQLLVLVADALLTGAIIFVGIALFQYATGRDQISLIEMIALFSVYAIFFYSTFMTSIWAWAYCLSSWLARLSARLGGWIDLKDQPGRSLALICAGLVLVLSLALKPQLTMDAQGKTKMDDMLCTLFASTCTHLARLSASEEEELDYMSRACLGGVTEECLYAGMSTFKVDPAHAIQLFDKSCRTGDMVSCTNMGILLSNGHSPKQDYARAAILLKQGCDGGVQSGCSMLGYNYKLGLGVPVDYDKATELFEGACENNHARSCTNLGFNYSDEIIRPADEKIAAGHFAKGCDLGDGLGCSSLGYQYEFGLGVPKHIERAQELYRDACNLNDGQGCINLGIAHQKGINTEVSLTSAYEFFSKACDLGEQRACGFANAIAPDRQE